MLYRIPRPFFINQVFTFSSFTRSWWVLALGVFILLAGCKKDPEPDKPNVPDAQDPLTPTAQVTTSVAGQVVDESGEPLKGVKVLVAGQSATTSEDGIFSLRSVSVPGNRCVITGEKTGYFSSVRAEIPVKDAVTRTRLVLMSSAPTHTFESNAGGKASMPNGSEVQIPADGLVTASGSAYTGTVNMTVRYQDPTAADFSSTVAGGDMLARRTDNRTSVLYSYGILRVKMTDAGGQPLQVAPGKTATLTIDIPDNQLSTAPATIPLWYFDEAAGVWKEEGSAQKQGDKYIGTVKHFTDWNADDPKESATIIGKVADCDGNLIPFCPVQLGQINLEASGGSFVQRVPTGVSIPVTISPYSGFYGKLIVIVPPLSPGQVYNVGTLQSTEFCPTGVKGTVKPKKGDNIECIYFIEPRGSIGLYMPGNSFSVQLPKSTEFTMKVYTTSGMVFTKTFRTGDSKTELDLGEINLDGAPVTVSGLVVCNNTYLSGANVKLAWAGQNKTVTTDQWGFFEAQLPANQVVTATVTHAKGSKSFTFQTTADPTKPQALETINLCGTTGNVGENSFVIHGDGWTNAKQTLSYDAVQSYAAYGLAIDTPDNTIVSISEPSEEWQISLVFAGKAVGAVGADQYKNAVIRRKTNNRDVSYLAGTDVEETSLSIQVTRYDPVGGLIEGTYSGTFIGVSTTGVPTNVTISQGKFSAIRMNDLY